MTRQEHTVKCTVQISTPNTAQLPGPFGEMVDCSFSKRVDDMTRAYNQIHRTDKYSEHSSIILSLWPNG